MRAPPSRLQRNRLANAAATTGGGGEGALVAKGKRGWWWGKGLQARGGGAGALAALEGGGAPRRKTRGSTTHLEPPVTTTTRLRREKKGAERGMQHRRRPTTMQLQVTIAAMVPWSILTQQFSPRRLQPPLGRKNTISGGALMAIALSLAFRALVIAAALARGAAQNAVYASVSTVAGNSGAAVAVTDGTGADASMQSPYGLAVDLRNDDAFFIDEGRLRKMSSGGVVTTVAGSSLSGTIDGVGTLSASFLNPRGVAVDSNGVVFVAETDGRVIRKVTSVAAVTTFAGGGYSCQPQYFADGIGTSACFNKFRGIAVDPTSGFLLVADTVNNRIRKVSPSGVVTTFAGNGTGAFADGVGTRALFKLPSGVAISLSGTAFVTDNSRIRMISPSGVVSTLAGKTAGYADGVGAGASFTSGGEFVGVAVSSGSGNVFVADSNRIRMVTPTGAVTTLAGNALGGFADGVGTDAFLSGPYGLALNTAGDLLISDQGNRRIRKLSLFRCPAGYFCSNPNPALCLPGSACPSGSFAPTPCAPGTFSSSGASLCTPCARASYTSSNGSVNCASQCAPGTYGFTTGGASASQACTTCSAGKFTDYFGATFCDPCPPGRFGPSAGANSVTSCLPCPPGTLNPFSGAATLDDCGGCSPGSFSSSPGSARCTPCPAGTTLDFAGGTTALNCTPCRAGTYNPAPGQTSASCASCPAGTFSAVLGAVTPSTCMACAASTFSLPGAASCTLAPAGTYSPATGASAPIDCPLGRFNEGIGSASLSACNFCAAGSTTTSPGAFAPSQCIKGDFSCPLGTQPASAALAPTGPEGCAPLACPPPLRPQAFASVTNDTAALAASSYCAGCGPGTRGAPGACVRCAAGEFCPGLLSRSLINFSAESPPPSGRISPWGACQKLSAPLPLPQRAGAGGSPFSRAQQAATAGGAFLVALLLAGLATARMPPPQAPRSWAAHAERVAKALDIYSLAHDTEEERHPLKRSTAAGGVFTLLGLTGIATYAAYMVLQWQDSNTLVQRSLDAVDNGVWGLARGLSWAAAPLPGAPSATGLLLRITLDGEPGNCSAPLAPPSSNGMLRGDWVLVGAMPDCGGSGVSQLTYACTDCDIGPGAALSFFFHYSCQSLLLEAAAVPAYPAGSVSLVVAEAAATAAAPTGGGLLSDLTWEVPPLLTQCLDNVTAGGAATKRGYAFMLASVTSQRPPVPADVTGGLLLLRPNAASLNLTIALPLSPTYVITSLTPLVPWTQLLANIVGLSGVLTVVGVLFGAAEKKLAVKGEGLAAAAARRTLNGGDAAVEIAALQRALFTQHADQQRQLAALAERVFGVAQPREPLEVTINPLCAASAAAAAVAPRKWRRYDDAEDVWFVAEDTGETLWEMPLGDEEVQ